jgi:hypothetical protein
LSDGEVENIQEKDAFFLLVFPFFPKVFPVVFLSTTSPYSILCCGMWYNMVWYQILHKLSLLRCCVVVFSVLVYELLLCCFSISIGC